MGSNREQLSTPTGEETGNFSMDQINSIYQEIGLNGSDYASNVFSPEEIISVVGPNDAGPIFHPFEIPNEQWSNNLGAVPSSDISDPDANTNQNNQIDGGKVPDAGNNDMNLNIANNLEVRVEPNGQKRNGTGRGSRKAKQTKACNQAKLNNQAVGKDQSNGNIEKLLSNKISNITGSRKSIVSPSVIQQNMALYTQLTAPKKQNASEPSQKFSQEKWMQCPNPNPPVMGMNVPHPNATPTFQAYKAGTSEDMRGVTFDKPVDSSNAGLNAASGFMQNNGMCPNGMYPNNGGMCPNSGVYPNNGVFQNNGMYPNNRNVDGIASMMPPPNQTGLNNMNYHGNYDEMGNFVNGQMMDNSKYRTDRLNQKKLYVLEQLNYEITKLKHDVYELKVRNHFLNLNNRQILIRLKRVYEQNEYLRSKVEMLQYNPNSNSNILYNRIYNNSFPTTIAPGTRMRSDMHDLDVNGTLNDLGPDECSISSNEVRKLKEETPSPIAKADKPDNGNGNDSNGRNLLFGNGNNSVFGRNLMSENENKLMFETGLKRRLDEDSNDFQDKRPRLS